MKREDGDMSERIRIYVPISQELIDDDPSFPTTVLTTLARELAWAFQRDRPAITWTFEPFPRVAAAWRRLRRTRPSG